MFVLPFVPHPGLAVGAGEFEMVLGVIVLIALVALAGHEPQE